MMLAWQRVKKTQARMWGEWMTIGEGLLEGRRWAMQMAGTNKPEGKGYVVAYAECSRAMAHNPDRLRAAQSQQSRHGLAQVPQPPG